MQIDRRSLLTPKTPCITNEYSMLTSFSTQHRDIKTIIERHWEVLKNDCALGTILPEQPKVIYRGAPSLQNKISSLTRWWVIFHVKSAQCVNTIYVVDKKL